LLFNHMCLSLALATAQPAEAIDFTTVGAVVVDEQAVRAMQEPADATVRRTDPGGAEPLDINVNVPDLISTRIGRYEPCDDTSTVCPDIYTGAFVSTGGFMRIDLTFAGLVNPPGPLTNTFDPTLYGDSPVLGYVEFDVDNQTATGGNRASPEFRYNANVARFGGKPQGAHFVNRIGIDGQDSDQTFATPPWIDRSGVDLTLTLFGETADVLWISELDGDNDGVFEEQETWDIGGRFLQRAQSYDAFAFGGAYRPVTEMRFAHRNDQQAGSPGQIQQQSGASSPTQPPGATTVSMVYPLTQDAYARLTGEPVEEIDADAANASSIQEALTILSASAAFLLNNPPLPNDPYVDVILDWDSQNPDDFLNPGDWRVTFLLGTARPQAVAGEGNLIWTDVLPNVKAGDFNGDGLVSRSDARLFNTFMDTNDGQPDEDADGISANNAIEIIEFGVRFSIYDINYDGVVDDLDFAVVDVLDGDADFDDDVDLADLAMLQQCFTGNSGDVSLTVTPLICREAFDLDDNMRVNLLDYAQIETVINGPNAP